MADSSSTTSSSSQSSSSSGEIQNPVSLIDDVESAIRTVCKMQSYRMANGRAVTYANLGELRALRAELQAEIVNDQGTRPAISRARFTGNF